MAKLSFDDGDGVWRTVGGRRIFIRTGESLSSAMKKSGKFKSAKKKGQRKFEDVDKEFHEHAQKMEKNYEEFGGNSVEDERKLNELSRERDKALLYKDKKEFTREELKEKYGTDDVDLINAGKEKEDRVALKEGAPLQKMANDRIKEKENTLANDKAMLEAMKRNGTNEVNGWKKEDFENRIKKNEEYLRVAKEQPEGAKFSKMLEENNVKTFADEIKKQNKIETISKAEYDKMPNDYKGTLKELVETAEFRGENKQDLIKQYEKMGYDVEKDKTILKRTERGTTLIPVKINDENKNNNNQITNILRRKAYQKYLKEHPTSKITFEDFKDMRK